MANKSSGYGTGTVGLVCLLAIAGLFQFSGCKKEKTAAPPETSQPRQSEPAKQPASNTNPKPPEANSAEANFTQTVLQPEVKLRDVLAGATRWGPAYDSWYGKTAPDFTVTDLKGAKHKLSDYRGKNVLLVFWATWCMPCRHEVPHLIAFQNITGKDKLEILAVSYVNPRNSEQAIRSFVEQNDRINYTVCTVRETDMPRPFNAIEYIPCSFFINPDGTIKLATSGLLTLGDMRLIMQAK
jgi:thiol-disulfide isomerase/thioredoxin